MKLFGCTILKCLLLIHLNSWTVQWTYVDHNVDLCFFPIAYCTGKQPPSAVGAAVIKGLRFWSLPMPKPFTSNGLILPATWDRCCGDPERILIWHLTLHHFTHPYTILHQKEEKWDRPCDHFSTHRSAQCPAGSGTWGKGRALLEVSPSWRVCCKGSK